MAQSFNELRIWQISEQLVVKIYKMTDIFPKDEVYNIVSQLRRAAVSIPTNIAEAHGRYHDAETIHFLYNARGSAEEVRSLLMTSLDLGYITNDIFQQTNEEYLNLIRSINSFVRAIRKTNQPINQLSD
ncbi:four helix bundle protein [Candidatus Daviesbacteria bacterium]|nr:four helix bundle protein [Candidatus Daviesbacteria bacterium]